MISDILQASKTNKSLIGINYYGSESGFYCGYVLDFNDDFLIFQHFTKFGMDDGLLVHKLSDIKYFEKDTEYLKGIDLLREKKEIVLKQTFSLGRKKDLTESFLSLFESFIGNKDQLIKFELNDGDIYFGFIEWCEEDTFSVINIDVDGIAGKAVFKFEDLKLYWIDDMECRKRNLVYKAKYSRR